MTNIESNSIRVKVTHIRQKLETAIANDDAFLLQQTAETLLKLEKSLENIDHGAAAPLTNPIGG